MMGVMRRLSSARLRAPVALLGLPLIVSGLTACGTSHPTGQTLVDSTFTSHTPVERGILGFTLAVDPVGPHSSGSHPVELDVNGPFQGSGSGRLPSFEFKVGFTAGGHHLQTEVTGVSSQLFVQLGGTWFATPGGVYRPIEKNYAEATRSSNPAKQLSIHLLAFIGHHSP
jgi:hypothetical protein